MYRPIKISLIFLMTLGVTCCATSEMKVNTVPEKTLNVSVKNEQKSSMVDVDSFHLAIYPPSSGIQFYHDSILFLSPSKNEKKMIARHISFGAVEAYHSLADDSVTGKHKLFSRSQGFTYPCEAVTFTSDYKTMYFTRIPKKESTAKIYMAVLENRGRKRSGWIAEDKPLEFCLQGKTYSHPALSPDGNMMVFASDIEGGSGKMDLLVTRKEGARWSSPQNLGTAVNTSGNEFYPFIDHNNKLYFSSDGLRGYGGYDIFVSIYNGTTWDLPINLAAGINTPNDDVAFTMNRKDGTLAFYSTIEKSEKRSIQLFTIRPAAGQMSDTVRALSEIIFDRAMADTTFRYRMPVTTAAVKQQEVKQQEVKQPEKKEEAKPAPVIVPAEKAALPEVKEVKPPAESSEAVVYRVQIKSSIRPQGSGVHVLNGVSYNTYEYLYLREYRSTIGKFSSLKPAVELQNALRKAGVKDAFVVAFKNNVRSLDMSLFR